MRLSRRRLLAAVPLAAAGGVLGGCVASGGWDQDHPVGLRRRGRLWDVPEAAWWRGIGDHPLGATGRLPSVGSSVLAGSRTQRGVPVGGIGAGSFMVNLSGSFGPWHMDVGGDDSLGARWGSEADSGFEQRFLPQAAFHVRYDTRGGPVVQTLATEDVLPAWPRLAVGQGRYSALFPKAWFEYEGLPLPTALKLLSPFVAGDERRSSLPAALFQMAFANPGAEPHAVSCMFSFPNAPYRLPTAQYSYTRQGLRSSAVSDGAVAGVRLQAESPANAPETERSEWVLAASGPHGATVSWTDDWAADQDGADLFEEFASSGRLPDRAIDLRRLGLGGAVAVSLVLPPGARRAVSFALAWDFPVVQFRSPAKGTRWWKRYTEFYPGPYRAWHIARDVLDEQASIEQAVDGWWLPIAEGAAYPQWLRTAALNELYYDLFGGVFWENGCITKPKRFGRRPGQHLYFSLESDVYRDCESLDVRHYEARHLRQLFPTIERDVLLGWADLIMADSLGRTPHDAGSPVDDPWFVPGQYAGTCRGQAPMTVDWLDLPAKFVQQSHAYWQASGDDDFGAGVYPAAVKTMTHLLSHDADGDGVPDATGLCTTYDAFPMHGASIYVAALTIGACEAMAELAATFEDPPTELTWRQAAQQARQTTESLLWVDQPGYYRLDTAGPCSGALLSDALCGQRYAAASGLPDVLDLDRMASHLLLVYERNVRAIDDGRLGAVNASLEPPHPELGFQARAVWPGGTYFTAAVMYQVGQAANNAALVAAALHTAYGVYRTTYEDEEAGFWFDTPALWVPGPSLRYRAAAYLRCRAAWELLAAIKDPLPVTSGPVRRPGPALA